MVQIDAHTHTCIIKNQKKTRFVMMEDKRRSDWQICPITRDPFEHPVVLPCGHTFDRDAIGLYLASQEDDDRKRCPMRCELPADVVPVPNFSLMSAMEEHRSFDDDDSEGGTYWMTIDSQLHVRRKYKKSFIDFGVHQLRSHVMKLLPASGATLFGGTVLRLIKSAMLLRSGHLRDGAKIHADSVLSCTTDVDVFFDSEDQVSRFICQLKTVFSVKEKFRTGAYHHQSVIVKPLELVPILRISGFREICLRMDVVRKMTDAELTVAATTDDDCLGFVWPDVDWNQIACRYSPDEKELILNPCVDSRLFFRQWLRPCNLLESDTSMLIRDLVTRIEKRILPRWCLIQPMHLKQIMAVLGKRPMQDSDYPKYLSSMVLRAEKFMQDHGPLDSLGLDYDPNTQLIRLPCGHGFRSVHTMCSYSAGSIVATCSNMGCSPRFIFDSFLDVA